MADGFGNVRLVFPPVVALSGDLIEHRDMSALGGSVSPVSMATTEQFGDGQAYPPRTKAHTLNTIYEIAQKFDPWELHDFQRECTKHGLNGVHKPWWRDYALTDPSIFCVPDLLHTVYKFFWDHLVKAAQIAVGTTELDRRFATLHRRIGHPHLRRVSEAKQMTGRMYREIMRTMIVVLHGAVTPGFMRAMRSILDYFLLAQSPRHTPHSLARMTLYLRKFHENKQAIMDAGGRGTLGHWQIPKLELLVNMVPSILSSGALPQWSCDRVERLLRTEAKFPFTSRSNRQRIGHGAQCAQHLDRVEKMRLFCLYTLFRSHGVELIDRLPDPAALESSEVADDDGASGVVETATVVDSFDVTRSWVLRALPETDAERYLHGPRPTHNLFVTGTISVASEVAFHINRKPDAVLRIDEAATIYQIADFRAALADYVHGLDLDSRGGSRQHLGLHNNISFDSVRAWQKYRIQLRSVQTPGLYMDPETLMAFPPGSDHPLGMCDTVLVDSLRADGQPRSCAPVHEGHAMEQSYDTTTVLEIPEHFWLNDMWDREIHDAIFTHYG
ncbi:hypothetical protein DENSPDRAFT_901372 [Dentipellis sp. KUC8613]|nr:hypothetical protein DENSPDRAFT_901372 [Dentipellis sp. KUC8613]